MKSFFPFVFFALLFPLPAQAFSAAADHAGGYSSQILGPILQAWKQPEGARGMALFELKVAPSGALSDCRILRESGSPAADASVCVAARNAAPYPYPPYGVETLVTLAFSYGAAEASAKGPLSSATPSYAETLRQNIAPRIILPQGLSGSWTSVLELDIWADGTLRDCRVARPSGNPAVDEAVMAAVRTPGAVTPPPVHSEQRVILSFTLSAR